VSMDVFNKLAYLLGHMKRIDVDVDVETKTHLIVLTPRFHARHLVEVILLQLLDIEDIFKQNRAHLVFVLCFVLPSRAIGQCLISRSDGAQRARERVRERERENRARRRGLEACVPA
jgi:hypothetical protein